MARWTVERHHLAYLEGLKYVAQAAFPSFEEMLTSKTVTTTNRRVKFRMRPSRSRAAWIKAAIAIDSELPWYRVVARRGKVISAPSVEFKFYNLKAPILLYIVSGGWLLGRVSGFVQLHMVDPLNIQISLRDLGLILESEEVYDWSYVRDTYETGGCDE